MSKLLVQSNFSISKLMFITMDLEVMGLEVIEDLYDSAEVDCGAEELLVESLSKIFKKGLTFINLQ